MLIAAHYTSDHLSLAASIWWFQSQKFDLQHDEVRTTTLETWNILNVSSSMCRLRSYLLLENADSLSLFTAKINEEMFSLTKCNHFWENYYGLRDILLYLREYIWAFGYPKSFSKQRNRFRTRTSLGFSTQTFKTVKYHLGLLFSLRIYWL